MSKEAYISVGIPGSGKSSFMHPLAEAIGADYINKDEIRKQLTGDMGDVSRDDEVVALAHAAVDESVAQQRCFVYDATSVKPTDRKALFDRIPSEYATIGIIFDTPVATCHKRNTTRSRMVPDWVIDDMAETLAANPPDLAEGFTRIVRVTPTPPTTRRHP